MDGGALSAALPQFLFGAGPMFNTSVPPSAIAECENHGLFKGAPFRKAL
jgi:hypothetical protein